MSSHSSNPLLAPVVQYLLLALADGPSWGYAIMKQIELESAGAVRPDIGALYRIIARLSEQGWVEGCAAPASADEVHPGRARRYYRLTRSGRAALRTELARLRAVVELGARHDLVPRPSQP